MLAWDKAVAPSRSLMFIGNQSVEYPREKIDNIMQE
jgi:hypothetical protein